MSSSHYTESTFLNRITQIIEENISNDQFGVSELARATGMSRSNLLRKVKQLAGISVSQFIRQVRLIKGLELLKEDQLTVSEVAYRVGFSSPSYFIKCFRDHYGYPPGEVWKRNQKDTDTISGDFHDDIKGGETRVDAGDEGEREGHSGKKGLIISGAVLITLSLLVIVLFVFIKPFPKDRIENEKSIAVLPFINDSNDSSNVHIVNGLMESILNNLQKIEDLRVISRTSVEKYRNNPKNITEIARELDVHYLLEGSGQKIGDQIMLHVQLIDATTDKHLWAEQYNRKAGEIFELQKEVAKRIANEIEAVITPQEQAQINKFPTQNLEAYDNFLKGLDLLHRNDRESTRAAIPYFEKAVELDDAFARAYAGLAISYFFLDALQAEKMHTAQIDGYADQALLHDPELAQSLVAKALYYINSGAYESAVSYLEKALEYNPNSAMVINILSDFYTRYMPNTEKYLEYALKGIKLDIAANDSATASFIYLHVSNALIQSGFINEAVRYINKSLEYNPDNLYSEYVKAFILYARDRDLQKTKSLLVDALARDTTRFDILQEVAKICYYMRDFEEAYKYYRKFIDIREAYNLDMYNSENAKIGVVLSKMDLTEESEKYFNLYKNYAENDKSVYHDIGLSLYYSFRGDTAEAMKYLRNFSQEDNYFYWTLLFTDIDPLVDNIKVLPEYKALLTEIEANFWEKHAATRAEFEKKDLL